MASGIFSSVFYTDKIFEGIFSLKALFTWVHTGLGYGGEVENGCTKKNPEKCSGLMTWHVMTWHVMTCHMMTWNFERVLKLVLTNARDNFSCKIITCHFGDVALDDVA